MILTYLAQIDINTRTGEFTGWFPNFVEIEGVRSRAVTQSDMRSMVAILKQMIRDAKTHCDVTKKETMPAPVSIIQGCEHRLDGDIFTFWQKISIDTGDDQ